MSNKNFDFSFVFAVYNVGEYIEEAVDSVINQSIGFEEHVQLVFVDDGSPDNSGEICDRYKALYPDNVVVLHKENEGAAKARRDGIKLATGKYVTFLDPDDILTPETLENVYNFFEKHYDEVDIVSIPLFFFGDITGPHPLNNKFELGTRVIDLNEDWQVAQQSMASAYFKREILSLVDADPMLVTAEDAKELIKMLLVKMKLGVVAEAKYRYRKRGDSQVGRAQQNPNWYLTYIEHFSEWALKYSKETLGYIPKFVQYTVLYDLQWKLRPAQILAELDKETENEYKERLFDIAKYLDEDVILCQSSIYTEHKLYLAYRKTGKAPDIQFLTPDNAYFTFDKYPYYPLRNLLMTLTNIEIKNGFLYIYGTQTMPNIDVEKEISVVAIYHNQVYKAMKTNYDDIVYSAGVEIARRFGFVFKLPLSGGANIKLALHVGQFTIPSSIKYGKYLPLNPDYRRSYFYRDGYSIFSIKQGFKIVKTDKKALKKQEKNYLKDLRKSKNKAAKKAWIARKLYSFMKTRSADNIWLITDKADRADDNGEALFKYLCQNKDTVDCTPVFAISKESPDYKRLKQYGKVIPYMSWRHKMTHLLAKHTVSAYSHDEISTPFLGHSKYYSDLLANNKIIFLQHGIIKDDLSKGLNKRHKNFKMFVTSTERERQSILDCNYGYTDSEVVLTGLPRYDYLYNDPQKKITIMPTWERSLFGTYDASTSRWSLLPDFENSTYYQFYNALLNSDKLLSYAEEHGYKIQFMAHPVLFPYIDRFTPDPRAIVLDPRTSYRDIFAQSSLITTDYSSVAFDFAYLKKPIVYTQFEKNHYEEGYFDYERDGFGEIEVSVEDTVDRLIEYMENDCKLKDIYLERIDKFYAFHDRDNCKRVYEAIVSLDKK